MDSWKAIASIKSSLSVLKNIEYMNFGLGSNNLWILEKP